MTDKNTVIVDANDEMLVNDMARASRSCVLKCDL
jgi:hypothetical protein